MNKVLLNTFLLLILMSGLLSCAVQVKEVIKVEPVKPAKLIVDEGVQQQFSEAVVLLNEGDYSAAVLLLNKVLEKEKRFVAPYVNLGMAYFRMNDFKLAEFNLRSAVQIDLGHAEANNELGLLYRKMRRFPDARKALENAIADHPDYLPALQNLGILCDLYMRDYDCALKSYESYLDIESNKIIKIWITDLKQRMK